MVANPGYWDKARGPHLREVMFRNDLSAERALELVCTTEGEVDLLTELWPADAARVEASEHARLVAIDAIRIMAGVINRAADGVPLADRRARLALNYALDRRRIVRDTMFGRARPLAGLTPPAAVTALHRLLPSPQLPRRAARLWQEAGGTGCRTLRLAALGRCEHGAREAVACFAEAGIPAEVVATFGGEEELRIRRELAQKEAVPGWDVLILEHGAQAADGPPLELHRAFVGATGEFRAGPVIPEFETMYDRLAQTTSKVAVARHSYRIDRFVRDEALVLSLCAPQALYAVNRHVEFRPYRTTFELAETRVDASHWSRRAG